MPNHDKITKHDQQAHAWVKTLTGEQIRQALLSLLVEVEDYELIRFAPNNIPYYDKTGEPLLEGQEPSYE